MDLREVAEFDQQHIWHPYNPMPSPVPALPVTSAHGVYLEIDTSPLTFSADASRPEVETKSVIDGMSSWWTAAHGHSHPALVQAAHKQIDTMSHVMFGGLTHEPAVRLAHALVEITPGALDKVFFCDSGSVAVEVALKMAYQYHMGTGHPERNHLISFHGGYHGDTFATMSLCDPHGGMHALWSDRVMVNSFGPKPPARGATPAAHAEFLAAVEQLITPNIAGMIIEPLVQGAGGMHFYDPEILQGLRRLCDEHGILLIFDEIATGFGRTGEMFAADAAQVTPDIMCVGKALTGGFLSLAATITNDSIAAACNEPSAGGALLHGPTYMGNPLACAVAAASLELFRSDYWRPQVAMIHAALQEELLSCATHPAVADARVFGAIGVLEMREPVDMRLATRIAVDHGVWLRPFGCLVYTMPPFISTREEVTTIARAMRAIADSEHQRSLV